MEIKHHTTQLQDIGSGDIRDNAQYIYLYFDNSNRKIRDLFTCKMEDGSEYVGRLFGRTEVIDSDGHEINDCKIFLEYLNKNKSNLVNYNFISGIELVDKSGKRINVFTSMHDCFDYLNKKEEEMA
jgi:hypothetical protein